MFECKDTPSVCQLSQVATLSCIPYIVQQEGIEEDSFSNHIVLITNQITTSE